jgi:hypothetical protein
MENVYDLQTSYMFKCSYKQGEHNCNGNHFFEINDAVLRDIIDRMIFVYKMNVNENIILDIISKFILFVENSYEKNLSGEYNLSHFNSIDMHAELMHQFTVKEFGEPPSIIKESEDITTKELDCGDDTKMLVIYYNGSGDPVKHLDKAVSQYVIKSENYREFIDADMDNPWVRIVVKGKNPMSII